MRIVSLITGFGITLIALGSFGQQPTLAPPRERAPGQKFIDEVWEELQSERFRTPTFEELATTHEGLSFEELWEVARRCNPSLRQKANLISAAQGGRLQAGLPPNPTLTYAGDNLGVQSQAGKHGMGIAQEIVTAKKKKLDRSVASFDVEIARRNYEMECMRVQNDLKTAYCEMIHAQLSIKIEEYCRQLSLELLENALRLQKEGKSRTIDVLQFRTAVNESALLLRRAENNRDNAWQRMTAVLGTPEMPYQPVRGSLLDRAGRRHWDEIWPQFQRNSPQLAVARLKVGQARIHLARQEAERVSNFSAIFQLSQDIPAENTVPFVGISVPLKIYDKNQGNIAKARAELAAAHREVERITLSLYQKMSDVYREYENARALMESYEQSILPDTFRALRLIDATYRSGEITYLELYNQRHNVMTTLLRYVDALKEQAVGTTLLDGMLLQGTFD